MPEFSTRCSVAQGALSRRSVNTNCLHLHREAEFRCTGEFQRVLPERQFETQEKERLNPRGDACGETPQRKRDRGDPTETLTVKEELNIRTFALESRLELTKVTHAGKRFTAHDLCNLPEPVTGCSEEHDVIVKRGDEVESSGCPWCCEEAPWTLSLLRECWCGARSLVPDHLRADPHVLHDRSGNVPAPLEESAHLLGEDPTGFAARTGDAEDEFGGAQRSAPEDEEQGGRLQRPGKRPDFFCRPALPAEHIENGGEVFGEHLGGGEPIEDEESTAWWGSKENPRCRVPGGEVARENSPEAEGAGVTLQEHGEECLRREEGGYRRVGGIPHPDSHGLRERPEAQSDPGVPCKHAHSRRSRMAEKPEERRGHWFSDVGGYRAEVFEDRGIAHCSEACQSHARYSDTGGGRRIEERHSVLGNWQTRESGCTEGRG